MTDDHRTECEQICRKWVATIGGGFHPDIRGKDYDPPLSKAQVAEYEHDMDELFSWDVGDPYLLAVAAVEWPR